MVAKLEGPQFSGGANIAIKCPSHMYEQTVAFYRDTLGLPLIEEEKDGCIFQFGPNRLWIDNVPNLSHPDIWLELETNDTEAAASFLKVNGVAPRRDRTIAGRFQRLLHFCAERCGPSRHRPRGSVAECETLKPLQGYKVPNS